MRQLYLTAARVVEMSIFTCWCRFWFLRMLNLEVLAFVQLHQRVVYSVGLVRGKFCLEVNHCTAAPTFLGVNYLELEGSHFSRGKRVVGGVSYHTSWCPFSGSTYEIIFHGMSVPRPVVPFLSHDMRRIDSKHKTHSQGHGSYFCCMAAVSPLYRCRAQIIFSIVVCSQYFARAAFYRFPLSSPSWRRWAKRWRYSTR